MIPYGRQTIDDEDLRAVAEVLASDWLTQGPKVAEFEAALASYTGAKHAVTFANGSLALQAAYFAAGVAEGDELITTPLTFAATASAALWFGAKPVFADVDPRTGNLDPKKAAAAITKKTKVLAPVDYSGRAVDLDAFRALGKERGLVVVSDACHSLGARYKGKPVGGLADMSVFSFHPVKSITTGEGGAVLTDSDAFASRLDVFRKHGITQRHPDWRYDIGELGQNCRLTDFQCALGLSQLKKLDGFIARRRAIAQAYDRELRALPALELPPYDADSAWHLYPVRLKLDALTADRAQVFADLRAAGIGVQVHYIPVYDHSLYRKLGYKANCPEADRFYAGELSLPIFPRLTDADRGAVVAALRAVLERYAKPALRS